MAASALEEKINKIRQQNEEIRRRHEEVEEDKKNAAKLNALVQMVPSMDWPERKEPPEFSNPPRANNKSKPPKEHHDHPQQYHPVSGEGRKVHTFAQGQGPPPDPKYNFLADSEREEGNMESTKDNPPNKGQKHSRGTFKRKTGGKDGVQRDYRINRGPHRDEHQPGYEAWRAERNRIDEDRISRQRTAEGNWRREWDNDKAHIVDEVMRPEAKLDYVKKDHKDFDRRYHVNGGDYAHYNRGNHRSHQNPGNSRHFYNNYENRFNNTYPQDGHVKNSLSPGSEERTVVATDKSIKVTLNQGNVTKGPVMSVKVNSPSIAGTGRVGPRQRSRITYSSHSDMEVAFAETDSISRPKSFEDKAKGIYHDNFQRSSNTRKSQPLPRKKDLNNKSPYLCKKDIRKEDDNPQKHHETELKSHARKEYKEPQKSYHSNFQKLEKNYTKLSQNDKAVTHVNEDGNVIASDESDVKDIELKNKDNQDNDLNIDVNDVNAKIKSELVVQNSDFSVSKVGTDIETTTDIVTTMENKLDEALIVQATALSECDAVEIDATASSVKYTDNNNKSETKSIIDPCDTNDDTKKVIKETKEQNLPTEQTEEILSNNCDRMQNESGSEQDIKHNTEIFSKEEQADKITVLSSTNMCLVVEENSKLEIDDKTLKGKETSVAEDGVVTDEKINISDKQDVIICANKIEEQIDDNNDEEKNNAANGGIVDTVEFPEEDLQAEEEKIPNKVIEIEK